MHTTLILVQLRSTIEVAANTYRYYIRRWSGSLVQCSSLHGQ